MKTKRYFQSLHCACMIVLAAIMSAFLTTPVLAQAVWDGTIATAFAGGDGTEEDPYQISTAAELGFLMQKVNDEQSENWSKDKYFKLTADIVLNTDVLNADGKLNTEGTFTSWTPIGRYSDSHSFEFQGTLDGDGHSISGLYYSDITTTGTNIGLFAAVYKATIKNLTIMDSYFNAYINLGGFVGQVTESTIDNCSNYAYVCANQGYCAGIAGISTSSTLSNCTNYGLVSGSVNSTAGIVGHTTNITVTNCVNRGEILSVNGANLGGVVGNLEGIVTGCHNYGYVHTSVDKNQQGGVIAYARTATIADCHNHGKVECMRHVGGILGWALQNNAVIIEDCSNDGEVSGVAYVGGIVGVYDATKYITRCTNSGSVTVTTSTGHAAGIVALLRYGEKVSYCSNSGEITGLQDGDYDAAPDYVGGIVGLSQRSIIGCTNSGTVRGYIKKIGSGRIATFNFYGGIVGKKENDAYIIQDNINTGDVSGNQCVAGIGGEIDDSHTINNRNEGEISGNAGVGGIAGNLLASRGRKFCNNYNLGKITGSSSVGGFSGYFAIYDNNTIVSDNHNFNTVTGNGSAVGGFAGELRIHYDYTNTITRCSNTGDVTNNSTTAVGTGGFLGRIGYYGNGNTSVYDCFNTGKVTSYGEKTGGLVGYSYLHGGGSNNKDVYLFNCYNTGSVTGFTDVGGIMGRPYGRIVIKNCYSAAPSITVNDKDNGVAGIIAGYLDANSTLINNYALKLGNMSLVGDYSTPKENSQNRSFGEDGTFTDNTVTVGAVEGFENLYTALNAWSEANSKNGWSKRDDRNGGYPYLNAFVVAKPVIAQNADNQYTITCATEGATIHYTQGYGNTPTATSDVYAEAFTASDMMGSDHNYINAVAMKEGYFDSEMCEFNCAEGTFTPGDVNNDGRVLTSDIVTTVNYILGRNPQPFIKSAADVVKDGYILVDDVTAIAQIILGTYTAPEQIKAREYGDAAMDMNAMDGQLNIGMSSSEAVQAYQMDITLPQGVKVTGVKQSERATATHSLGWNMLEGGVLRVIAYSMTGDLLHGNSGNLFTVSYTTDAAFGDADCAVTLDNIHLVKANGTSMQPAALTQDVDNLATGIVQISESDTDSQLYNLQGQKVGRDYKGIIVTRGRKVAVK